MKIFKIQQWLNINEAYQDLSDVEWKDEFDEAFGYYALNETPFNLTQSEKEDAKSIYGLNMSGIKNGLVYHGNRINTIEQLEKWQNISFKIKAKGKAFLDVDMLSTSQFKDEALSFSQYVKSYDEMTMLYSLQSALEQGSAGRYGGVLLTIKPKKENIIFNTNTGLLTKTAENEIILDGKVEIIDIIITEPLTKDNYLKQFNEYNLNSLKTNTSNFFNRWLSKHKLKIPNNIQHEFLEKNIKTYNEFVNFINEFNEYKILDYNSILEFIQKNHFFKEFLNNLSLKFSFKEDALKDTNVNVEYTHKNSSIQLPKEIQIMLNDRKEIKKIIQDSVNSFVKTLKPQTNYDEYFQVIPGKGIRRNNNNIKKQHQTLHGLLSIIYATRFSALENTFIKNEIKKIKKSINLFVERLNNEPEYAVNSTVFFKSDWWNDDSPQWENIIRYFKIYDFAPKIYNIYNNNKLVNKYGLKLKELTEILPFFINLLQIK